MTNFSHPLFLSIVFLCVGCLLRNLCRPRHHERGDRRFALRKAVLRPPGGAGILPLAKPVRQQCGSKEPRGTLRGQGPRQQGMSEAKVSGGACRMTKSYISSFLRNSVQSSKVAKVWSSGTRAGMMSSLCSRYFGCGWIMVISTSFPLSCRSLMAVSIA